MIEVLFGESEAASMKATIEEGVISGSTDKVICLALMLDIGDIRENIDSPYRDELIFDMYAQHVYDYTEESLEEVKQIGRKYIEEHDKLIKYALEGESIRIWYSNAPYAMSGFYYVCNILKDISNEIFTVKLPEYIQIQDAVMAYEKWGEVIPEKFSELIKYEKKMSKIEKIMFANNWLELVEDNSPLRAVVNGRLIGVPIDFYDHLIYKHLKFKHIKEVGLIGEILGYYPLGVEDWWYASRIDYMIDNNKIRIVEDSDNKYERTISNI